MNVNHKIFRLMLIALLCCFVNILTANAQNSGIKIKADIPTGNETAARESTALNPDYLNSIKIKAYTSVLKNDQQQGKSISEAIENATKAAQETQSKFGTQPAKKETKEVTVTLPNTAVQAGGSNTVVSPQQISACTSDYGMFSGLITAGGKIFRGLRELIYVVAGFGIIGVAVGGFFGTLNYKWLGAIVISLVIIATTGELINAITGCENFTSQVITDTLK